jgi:predicted adenylyl cyclase CyaB
MIEHIESRFTQNEFTKKLNSSKSYEVEEQVKLDPGQDILIQQKIVRNGGTPIATEIIHDVFFCPSDIDSYDELEKIALSKQIIRIRKTTRQTNDGQTETSTIFTTKVKSYEPSSAWEEHDFVRSGDHIDKGIKTLSSEGLKPYYQIEKSRSEWQLNDFTFSFDYIPDYGVMLEIEKHVDKKEIANTKDQIQTIMNSMGIRNDQKPTRSIMKDLVKTRLLI